MKRKINKMDFFIIYYLQQYCIEELITRRVQFPFLYFCEMIRNFKNWNLKAMSKVYFLFSVYAIIHGFPPIITKFIFLKCF